MTLLLPGHPAFYEALENLPLPYDLDASKCVVRRGDSLLLEAVNANEVRDYAFGGEYDLLQDEIDSTDEEEEEG